MNISVQEELMYGVMKAIYESGIPVSFKGSMVLKACLIEAGYEENTRHTVDIDANWNSDIFPTVDDMAISFQNAIACNDILLKVSPYRNYGEGRSAGFELKDETTEEVIFTMDVDVNRPPALTKLYEVSGLKFRGATPSQMIADKVCTISTNKLFRRIKDVIDLYYISHVCEFDCDEIIKVINSNNKTLGDFNGFLNRKDELIHSYEKFRFSGDIDKPEFESVYETVKDYINSIILAAREH